MKQAAEQMLRPVPYLALLAPALILAVKSVAQICLALLCLLAILGLTKRRTQGLTNEERWLGLSLLFYPGVVLFGFVWLNHYPWRQFDAPLRLALAAPILWFLVRADMPVLKAYRQGCALGCIGAAAWAVWTVNLPNPVELNRATNSFANPIHFGCIALILAFSALPETGCKPFERRVLIVCSILGLGAAIASQSRAIMLFMPLAFSLYAIYLRQWGGIQRRGWALVAALAMIGLTAALLKHRYIEGFMQIASHSGESIDSSMGIRLQLWDASTQIFFQHPLLGVGKGNFPGELKLLAENGVITTKAATFDHSHNEMLFLLVETGIAGALSVAAMYISFLTAFARRLASANLRIRWAAYLGSVTVVAYVIFGLVDCMLTISMQTAFLGLSITLIYAQIRQWERSKVQNA
ncbi:MAG: O-antigen ligase family protein [Rhodoferax sp.]|nr:O-antigen ligase family protein [Rhodoferax sp.]